MPPRVTPANTTKVFYGYKAHVSSDGEHQLIRAAVISTASQYDGDVLTEIAPVDSEVIYADKAYDTKANQAWAAGARHSRRNFEEGSPSHSTDRRRPGAES